MDPAHGATFFPALFPSNAIKVSNPHFKWGFIWNPSGVLY